MHAAIAGATIAAITLLALAAPAQNYRRPADAAVTPAPNFAPGDARARQSGQSSIARPVAAWNGMEGPAYGYGYALNLPADGNWRWIDPRCYDSGQGQICVEGHWIRRGQGGCEEVSAHQVRRGNYIRMVPAGQVASCRR